MQAFMVAWEPAKNPHNVYAASGQELTLMQDPSDMPTEQYVGSALQPHVQV